MKEYKERTERYVTKCFCDRCGKPVKTDIEEVPDVEKDDTELNTINHISATVEFERGICEYDYFSTSTVEVDICAECAELLKEIMRKAGFNIKFPSHYE